MKYPCATVRNTVCGKLLTVGQLLPSHLAARLNVCMQDRRLGALFRTERSGSGNDDGVFAVGLAVEGGVLSGIGHFKSEAGSG